MARKSLIACLVALALGTACAVALGDCRQFFAYRQAVVAVPVVAYPQVYYQAGRDIEVEAIVARAVKQAIPLVAAELRAGGSQKAAIKVDAFAKCVRCHGSDASVVLDGSVKIACITYARWGEIAGLGRNVPPEMKKLVDSLTPDEKGAVADAMLNLGAAERAPVGDLE